MGVTGWKPPAPDGRENPPRVNLSNRHGREYEVPGQARYRLRVRQPDGWLPNLGGTT